MSAIARSSEIKYYVKQRERHLQRGLEHLYRCECDSPGSCATSIATIKQQLNSIYEEHYRGAVIRSRAQKYIFGERPTNQASADEKRYALRKEIHSLEVENSITSDKSKIQQAFLDHYREHFGTRDEFFHGAELQPFLDSTPHLSNSDVRHLEEPITLEEIEEAVNNLAAGKSARPDGITADFDKHYKSLACLLLLEYIQYAYQVKEFPALFLQAHAVLLPKSDNADSLRLVTGYTG